MNLEFKDYIIMAVLIIVLVLIFPGKIMAAVKPLLSIGNDIEPARLTELKENCKRAPKDGCNIEIAELSLSPEVGENPLIAESFLKNEVEFSTNPKTLKECFEFARDILYPKLNTWDSATELYNKILAKLGNDQETLKNNIKLATYVSQLKTIYAGLKPTAASTNANLLESNKDHIRGFSGAAFKLYTSNSLVDMQILGDPTSETVCESVPASSGVPRGLSKYVDICNYESRASVKYNCFFDAKAKKCNSCYFYSLDVLSSTEDICSGYTWEESCIADPCNIGDCSWEGLYDGCKSKAGTKNYWDIS